MVQSWCRIWSKNAFASSSQLFDHCMEICYNVRIDTPVVPTLLAIMQVIYTSDHSVQTMMHIFLWESIWDLVTVAVIQRCCLTQVTITQIPLYTLS